MDALIIMIVSLAIIFMVKMADNIEKEKRLFIKAYAFPDSLLEKVKYHYPHLSDGQLSRTMEGLREYFIACAEGKFAYMPSRVVYVAWFEFSLFTELHDEFCKKGMGRYFHITPADVMWTHKKAGDQISEDHINDSWVQFCRRENQDPKAPARLPSLYALDAELDIPDGFRYSLDDCVRRYEKYLAKYRSTT